MLSDLARRSSGQNMLGTGAANHAQVALQSRAYMLYMREQESQGLPIVTPTEFAAGKR